MSSQTPPAFKSPYGPPGVPVDTRKLIHFATDGVQPPSSVYVDVNNLLLVTALTTDVTPTLVIRYTILNPAGELIQGEDDLVQTQAPRTTANFFSRLTEGFLMSLELSSRQSGPQILGRGLTRAVVRLARGTPAALFLVQTLVEGMVDQFNALTWPVGTSEPSCNGQGFIRSVTGTTPAAGAEISETVPTNARWGFRTFKFILTTSVAAANRAVVLLVDDGTNTLFAIESTTAQIANLGNTYSYGNIGARSDKVNTGFVANPFPNIILGPGYRIRTSTLNLQAADQYSAVQYNVEEWFSS